ncbi:MAG: glutamate--tRNA ligase family protein, partial [Acidimicrobiales bacterium]
RRDAVAVEEYRDLGYLPEAFVNYLALLGWSPRGDEVTSREVMVEQFDLADVSASPAFFDVKKLTHVNGDYLRALSPEEFVTRSLPWVAPHLTSWRPSDREALITEAEFDLDLFARVAPLVQTRVATLGEVPGMVEFFFVERVRVDDAAFVKVVTNAAHGRDMLAASATALATMGESEWKADALHEALARVAEAFDTSLAKAQAPLRCAVTGTLVGPPLFESIEVLGRERTLARASDALARAAT